MRARHLAAVTTLVTLLGFCTTNAAAQPAPTPAPTTPAPSPEDMARSEGLFKEAQVLLEAGKAADACPRFAESQKLAPGLGVSLYLADCWERVGRLASAHAEFKRAEAVATARKDARAGIARARATNLEPQIPTMTIRVPADARIPGLEIRRDEHVLPESEWDAAVAIDPGNHVISMSAPNRKKRDVTILVKASDKSVVTLLPLESAAPVVAAPVAPTTTVTTSNDAVTGPQQTAPRDAAPSNGSTQRWIGIGVGGAGLVMTGVGAVLGLSAKSKLDSSNENERCNAADQCTDEGLALRSDASGLATGSTVLFVLGGAALVGGVVLYLTAPKGTAPSTALTLKPGPGRAELTLGGSF